MGIEANCGRCGKQYAVPDTWAGKRVQCPRCQASVDVPVQIVDVVLTGNDIPSPFIDSPGNTNEFAPLSEPATNGPWRASPLDHHERHAPSHATRLGSHRLEQLLRNKTLMIGVGIGISVTLVLALHRFISKGFDFALLPHALLLTVGAVILFAGLREGTARHNRKSTTRRIGRLTMWFFATLGFALLAYVGIILAARAGVPIPSVAIVGAPLLLVPLFVAFVAAVLLAYNIAVLLFPKANILRFFAVMYIMLTVALPVVIIPIALIGNLTGHDRSTANVPEHEQANRPDDQPSINGMGKRLEQAHPSPQPHSSHAERFGSNRRSSTPLGQPDSVPSGANVPSRGKRGSLAPNPFTPGGPSRGNRASRTGPETGGTRRSPPSFESSVAKLASRFGVERVVTVEADPVTGKRFQEITQAIRKAAHADQTGYAASLNNGMLRVAVGPVNDIQAFADRLDIGDVVDVNTSGHIITIDVRMP